MKYLVGLILLPILYTRLFLILYFVCILIITKDFSVAIFSLILIFCIHFFIKKIFAYIIVKITDIKIKDTGFYKSAQRGSLSYTVYPKVIVNGEFVMAECHKYGGQITDYKTQLLRVGINHFFLKKQILSQNF